MSYLKFGFVALALALFAAPSIADAQSYQSIGTRRGAVGGAIVGAIIGSQNNEALAGAAIGGLVGGTIGNVGGRNLDRRNYGGQPIYNYGGNHGHYNRPAVNIQYRPVAPVYRPSPYVYRPGGGGGYGRPGCGGRGW